MTPSRRRFGRFPVRESGGSWITVGLCLLIAGTPLTVNAFGFAYRAAFQFLCCALGILALTQTVGARALLGGWSRWLWPLLGLWLLGVVRTPLALDGPAALMQTLDRTALMVPLLLLAGGAASARDRRLILAAGLVSMGVVAVWGMLQTFGIHPFMDRAVWQPSAPTRPLGTHNLMGGYLVAWLPVAAGWFLIARGPWKGGLAVIVAVGWWCLLLSESRGAWLAGLTAALVMAPWGLLVGRRALLEAWRRSGLAAWALAIVLVVLAGFTARGIVERLRTPARVVTQSYAETLSERQESVDQSLVGLDDTSDSSSGLSTTAAAGSTAPSPIELTSIERRTLIAAGALQLIGERPVLGFGPGSFRLSFYRVKPPLMRRLEALSGQTAVHAHWDALELASEHGLLGLLLVVVAIGGVLWSSRRLLRGAPVTTGTVDATRPGSGKDLSPDLSQHLSQHLSAERLIEAGLLTGTLGLLLHGLIDFDLHEVPTALTGAMFLGLLAVRPEPETGERLAARGGRPPRLAVGLAVVVLTLGIVGTGLQASAEALHRRAYRVLTGRDLDRATRLLERAQQLVPDSAIYAVALAEIDGHRDKRAPTIEQRIAATESSARHFEQAAQLEATVAGQAFRAAKAWQQAATVGSQAGRRVAQSWAATAARLNPYHTHAHLLVARLQREAGELVAAAATLDTAAARPPAGGPLPAVVLEQGRLAMAREEYDRAIELFVQVAGEHGRQGGVEALADLVRATRDRRPEMADTADRALRELADGRGGVAVQARLWLAELAIESGDLDAAAVWLERTAGRAAVAELAMRRGLLAHRRGRLEEAARQYRAVVAAEPLEPLGYQRFGDVALASGDTASALRSYERALLRGPDNPELGERVAALHNQFGK